MKNLMKKSLIIAFVCYSVIANAKSLSSTIMVNEIDSKSIELILNNFEDQVQVSIKDDKGIVLHKDNYNSPSLSIKYNFKLLSIGDYLLEIESDTKIKQIPFTVSYRDMELIESKEKVIYKPEFKKEDDLLFIYQLAINYEDLVVFIYDDDSHLLYKEKLTGKQVLERKLNISKLETGKYRLIMKTEGLTFTENFKI